MRERQSFHRSGLMAADRPMPKDFGAVCAESASQSGTASMTALEQSLTSILSADRSITIFADGTAAGARGDRRVVQFLEQAA